MLGQEKSKGASAQTFQGMLSYCEGHRPLFIVYENVDAIDDKVSGSAENNLAILMGKMRELHYEGQKVMTDAQEFGLPARRRRMYILFVDTRSATADFRTRASGQVFATFKTLVSSCVRASPCATECVQRRDVRAQDDIVQQALWDRRRAADKLAEKKAPPATWIDKHMAYAESLGVRWAAPVAQELAAKPWFLTMTKREQDALVLSRVDGPGCEFRNLSQSVGRINARSLRPEIGKEVAPTMLPGQLLWC